MNCKQTEFETNNLHSFRKHENITIAQESKAFLAYADEKRRINLIRYAGKFFAMYLVEGQEPKKINVNLPKYFENIPDEKISLALSRHGKHLVRSDENVVSVNIYPLLLGGGQVSSKVLSNQPSLKKSDDQKSDTRIEELNQQIRDVNLVLEEWRKKYKELEELHKTTKIEKIVEVPIENVKFIEVPTVVEKSADEKIIELQNQIESYEKRINDWRNKFYQVNESIAHEQSILSTENTIDQTKIEIEEPKEIVVQDENDSQKLKQIREKLRGLQQFSRDLQKKCISLESRVVEKKKEVPIEIVTYVDKPVETIVYDNDIVEKLKQKVQRLNDNLKDWRDKYQEYESGLSDVKFEAKRIDRSKYEEPVKPMEYIEEQDDESVTKLRDELDRLRETLRDWQTRLTTVKQEEIIVKTVEVPVEVVKYVERPIEKVKYDETKATELQSQISEIYGTIDEWKKKYQSIRKTIPQMPRYKFNPVKVQHTVDEVEDERVGELNKKVEQLKQNLNYWEGLYKEIASKEQQIIEREIRVEKPVTKYVEKPVNVYINDETKVNELKEKINEMYKKLEGIKEKPVKKEKKEPIVIEREVIVPVEKIKKIERKVEKKVVDDEKIKILTDHLNDLKESLAEWEAKCHELENKEVEVVERIEEVPVEIIKYIEKPVFVPQVNEERLKQVTEDYEKLQLTIKSWQEKFEKLSKKEIREVEKYVEVPVEVIQYIDIPVEIPVVDEERLKELTEQYERMTQELEEVKKTVEETRKKNIRKVDKYVENPIEVIEYIEIENEIMEVDQNKIDELTEECEKLTKTLDELKEKYEMLESREVKIVEKIVEVPIEVVEFVDREVEHRKADESKIKALQDEYDRLTKEIEEVKAQHAEYEKQESKVITKEVEVPFEKIEYVDKIVEIVKVDEEKVKQLTKEYNELCVTLNNWKNKFEAASTKQQKVIEKIVETPVEIVETIENVIEKVKVDEKRIRELQREYDKLTNTIENLKEQCLRLQLRQPKIVYKKVEVPVETFQYFDEKKDVYIVDEELLKGLNEEIEQLTKKHEEITNKFVEMEKSVTQVVEIKKEVPNYIEKYVDYEVEKVEIDEKRIHELLRDIDNLTDSIRDCQDRYNLIEGRDVTIIPSLKEIPVEVVEYDDHEVEVTNIDEEALEYLKNLYNELNKELTSLQEEIKNIEKGEEIVVEKVKKIPNKVVNKLHREVEVVKVDQVKLNNLRNELQNLNDRLNQCNDQIHDLQSAKSKVVEKIVEVPYEKIVYDDVENHIVQVDQGRIELLQNRIKELETKIQERKSAPVKKKEKKIQIVEKFVDQPFETVKYVDTEVEVVKLDNDKFDKVVAEYNALVDELKIWKIKCIELENIEPKIVERIVKIPIEKIVYVDVPVEMIVEDNERIEKLTKELESLNQSLSYWQSKTVEIETVKQRVVEKYVDQPNEVIEYIEREIEVIKVDEDRIKQLNEEYEKYSQELQKVKFEYALLSKAEPVIVEKIIEIPVEVIEEVEKVVEVKVVDQAKLDDLTKEYNEIIEKMVTVETKVEEEEEVEIIYQDKVVEKIVEKIEYVDVFEEEVKEDLEAIRDLEEQYKKYTSPNDADVRKTQQFVKLPPTIIEKKVEVPYEIIKFIDKEVTVVRRNESREKELLDQINETKNKIKTLQDQYERIEKAPQQVVRKVVEVPVEVIKYVDNPVEIFKYDTDKLDIIEKGVNGFRDDLIKWLEKYKEIDEPEDLLIEVKAEIPKPEPIKKFEEPKVKHDDDTRLRNVQSEMSRLNKILVDVAANFKRIETKQIQIVEIPVEVPVEVIKYVDRPYEVIVQDDARIKELENEISNIQKSIDLLSNTTITKEDHITEVHQTVKAPRDKHVPRQKEIYESHDNVIVLEEQIDEIYNKVNVWRNKYKELSKRDRKVIEKIVEVPIEVIKYVDKKIETVKKDDQRIQTLEKELLTLSNQFNEWQTIFSEQSETTVSSTSRTKRKDEVVGELPLVSKPDDQYLELTAKFNTFTQEFSLLKKNIEQLEKMEKIIIGKIVEVPKEVAEIIEYHIESEDYRPKQYLRQLESLNSKLEVWKKGIENKALSITPQAIEKKIDYQENFVDNTPILIRDTKAEEELEEELLEITKLIQEYSDKAYELELDKQEVIENVKEIKKEIEKVIYEDIEVLIKDTSHEETLEKLIKETSDAINEKKAEIKAKKKNDKQIIEKVVKVKKEVIKNVIRNIEIPKYDDTQVKEMEQKYQLLCDQLEDLIDKCSDFEHEEFQTTVKEVKVTREILRTIERQVGVEVLDEKPILEMVEKLNSLNKELTNTRNESLTFESGDVQTVENIIKKDVEIVKYEIRYKDVFVLDEHPVKDLEEKRNQLLERIKKWQEKVNQLEKQEEVVVEKIIEVPVRQVKTYIRSWGEIVYEDVPLKELAQKINDLSYEVATRKSEYSNLIKEKPKVEEKIVHVPKEILKVVENIIENVVWDDSQIKDLENKIKDTNRQIAILEDKTTFAESQKEEVIEKIIKVNKEIKRIVVKDIEKVTINEEPVKELEQDINNLNEILNSWKEKLNELKNEKVPVIEKIIEVEKEKVTRVKRVIEVFKNDDKPIQKALDKIAQLHRKIEEATNRVQILESRKLKIVEKYVEVPKDVYVFVPRRKDITSLDETNIVELEERKKKLIDELKEWKEKVTKVESEKSKTVRKVIEVPRKKITRIKRDLEIPVFEDNDIKDWEDKCEDLRRDIQRLNKRKIDLVKDNTKIVENVVEQVFDVIVYEDVRKEVERWDNQPIIDLENQIDLTKKLLEEAENKKKEVEKVSSKAIEKIVEVPKEVIKKVERKVDKIIWNDAPIHKLEDTIKNLVNKLNEGYHAPEVVDEGDIEIQEKVVPVPREIIIYRENIKQNIVYDDSPIEEVQKQIDGIKKEIEDYKEKVNVLSNRKERIIEKVIEEPIEIIKEVHNRIETIKFDEEKAKDLQAKIDAARKQQDKYRNDYKIKKSEKEVVVEKEIIVPRNVVKKVEKLKEIVKYDNTRVNELEAKLNKIKNDLGDYKNNLNKSGTKEVQVIERTVEVEKEVKIYKEKIVQKVSEELGPIKEMENKIKTAKQQQKSVVPVVQTVKKKKQEIRENIIETVKNVVKKVDRPIKVVRYDDTRIQELQKKVDEAKKEYQPIDHDIIEIIEEEGEIIEKIIEVPVKHVKEVDRPIEKIIWDESNILLLEKELRELQAKPDELYKKMEKLIEKKNEVIEEIHEVKVEVVKFVPKDVEIVKHVQGNTEELETELINLRKSLEFIIEEYKNLQNTDKEYIYKTKEIPYETVRYVEKPIEVYKVDNRKVERLEKELNRLKKVEEEIKQQLNKVEIQKSTVIQRKKNVPVEKVKTIERPVKTLKVNNDKLYLLEKKLVEATQELTKWQKKCEEYDIIKEKIVEVPVEVIKEVEYPVEVIKADDNLVKDLAFQVSSIKQALLELEAKHEILLEQQNETVEKIIEKPVKVEKRVEREINVVKVDKEKINNISEQIKALKNNLSKRQRDFSNYERNRNVIEERVSYEEEVVRLIQRPIEILTLDKKSMREIQRQFDRAYSLLEQWKQRYRELLDDKYTPEEQYIEVPVEKKKFAVSKVEIMKPDESDIEKLELEIERLTEGIADFKTQISNVQKNLKQVVVKEKKIEVPKENVVQVEVPTHIISIDSNSIKDIRNELRKLKSTVNSTVKI